MGTILPTTLDHELFQLDSNRETVPTTASRFVIYIHPSKKPFLLDKGSYRNTLGQCYSMCSKRDPVGLGKEKKGQCTLPVPPLFLGKALGGGQ